MPVREGGSYVADEKTGEITRVGGTEQPTGARILEEEPAPEVPTSPAAPATDPEPAPAETPDHHHPEA